MSALQDWALQVLTGERLADKLLPPPSDDAAPRRLSTPREPGRPRELAFVRHGGQRAPSPRQLRTPAQRGRVLHLFANHELLALELMALAILRFPDTPRAFRRGLAGVMAEEQAHLQAYLAQMARTGTALGSAPVGAFFWDALAPIDDPARFVAALALTLEQANLDFSREWAQAFRLAGDAETAAVLEQVYADEIRHVKHGLHWFRAWSPAGDLFETYRAALRHPLGPHRARGTGAFDAAGRIAAGLPAEFVDRIATFGASRGRTPDLYWFNPGVEYEVRNATPAALLTGLERDLATVPAVLAGRDDQVLVPCLPSLAWQKAMVDAGFPLPAFATSVEGPIRRYRPWGWSPRAAAVLGTAGPAGHAERLSRAWWCDREIPGLDPADRPVVAQSEEEAAAAVRGIRGPWVIKAVLTAGGRDRIRGEGPLGPRDCQWVARFVAAQGAVVVERWVDGVVDLSILAEDGRRLGITRFAVRGGAWAGHLTGPWTTGLPASIHRFLHEAQVARQLDAAAAAVDPGGAYGVDALIYREAGTLRLRPVIEVNARLSFGRIALALGARQHPRSTGWLRIARRGEVDLSALPPLVLRDGRPSEGVLLLNDPASEPEHLAIWWLAVGDRLPAAARAHVGVADPLSERADCGQ
jgi:uncharacterized ferritin-like protein (DUF455 family)